MRTFKLTEGDRVYLNGSWVIITESEAVKQRLENSLRLDLGSWFFNPAAGIDWFGIYGMKTASERLIRINIEKVLKSDPEVTKIKSLTISFDREKRKISAQFSVETVYGPIEGEI